MFVYRDNIQRTAQLMPEIGISLFQIPGQWFLKSAGDQYWKVNQKYQELASESFIYALCSVVLVGGGYSHNNGL